MLVADAATSGRLEAAQAWRATHYAHAALADHPDPNGAVVTLAGAQVVYAGAGMPVNRAIGLGMAEAATADHLAAIEEFYRTRGAAPRIDLCPLADPGLVGLLGARGYVVERFYSVLAAQLPAAEVALNAEIDVALAEPAEAERWLEVVGQGFVDSEPLSPDVRRILTPNFHARYAYPYFARLGGELAGGGGMYLHAGVAELGGASTLPRFRRRGVQQALLVHRLAAAHDLGCDLAMVLTTPGTGSQRNVQRMGFAVAYTKAALILSTA